MVLLSEIEMGVSPGLRAEIIWWREFLPALEGKTGPEIWDALPQR
jgi:hypothetical protein